MVDFDVGLSLVSSDGIFAGSDNYGFPIILDDISSLICCVDGKSCRDFVNCLRFKDFNGSIILVWRCPRFKVVIPHG